MSMILYDYIIIYIYTSDTCIHFSGIASWFSHPFPSNNGGFPSYVLSVGPKALWNLEVGFRGYSARLTCYLLAECWDPGSSHGRNCEFPFSPHRWILEITGHPKQHCRYSSIPALVIGLQSPSEVSFDSSVSLPVSPILRVSNKPNKTRATPRHAYNELILIPCIQCIQYLEQQTEHKHTHRGTCTDPNQRFYEWDSKCRKKISL